jgi:16S rRNA (guanine527-N7)-methyltransferase
MRERLQPLGAAWQPLLDRAVTALVQGGVELPVVWSDPAIRRTRLERLRRLLDLVVVWNDRIDLTGARDRAELVDLFLADALVLAAGNTALPETASWVDVGSGAGAPGLVLQLLRPELELTLVEPRAKRIAFLRTAIGTLGLPSQLVSGRSDTLPPGSVDIAVSRATFAPEIWLAEGARLARQSVWVLLARGADPSLPGWQLGHAVDYTWPLTGVARRALCFSRAASSTRVASAPA